MSEQVIEGLKQFARVVLAAILPLIIAGIQQGNIDVNGVLVALVIAVLMGIDKWVHKSPDIAGGVDKGGLAPF